MELLGGETLTLVTPPSAVIITQLNTEKLNVTTVLSDKTTVYRNILIFNVT